MVGQCVLGYTESMQRTLYATSGGYSISHYTKAINGTLQSMLLGPFRDGPIRSCMVFLYTCMCTCMCSWWRGGSMHG